MTEMPKVPLFEVPEHLYPVTDPAHDRALKERIKARMQALGAVLVAHYYTEGPIQDLAMETGGMVADSLEMARFGRNQAVSMLIVAGVRFMGETAKILSPNKRILMPTLEATCSLDLGCPADAFTAFCDANPERTVVVYANTSAAVKARSDWVVTSRNAVDVVRHLDAEGQKILWAPDRYLGQYIQKQTTADMFLWQGTCVVHEEFKKRGILDLKHVYPDAGVLAHPEAPAGVIELADVVGSTTQIVEAAKSLSNQVFIVATDSGLFHRLHQVAPEKTFIEAPTAGNGATCKSCAHCPWMAMNQLDVLEQTLQDEAHMKACEIQLDQTVMDQALKPLERMVQFKVTG